jgi:hypothetical protein
MLRSCVGGLPPIRADEPLVCGGRSAGRLEVPRGLTRQAGCELPDQAAVQLRIMASRQQEGADGSLLTLNLFRAAQGRPLVSVEAGMSVTMRVLGPAVTGERRCHFLVQFRDSHATQHGRTFPTWQEAAEFDAATKAGKLPRDAPGRRAAVTFGTAAARWLATKQAAKRPSTADLYATNCAPTCCPPSPARQLGIDQAYQQRRGSHHVAGERAHGAPRGGGGEVVIPAGQVQPGERQLRLDAGGVALQGGGRFGQAALADAQVGQGGVGAGTRRVVDGLAGLHGAAQGRVRLAPPA